MKQEQGAFSPDSPIAAEEVKTLKSAFSQILVAVSVGILFTRDGMIVATPVAVVRHLQDLNYTTPEKPPDYYSQVFAALVGILYTMDGMIVSTPVALVRDMTDLNYTTSKTPPDYYYEVFGSLFNIFQIIGVVAAAFSVSAFGWKLNMLVATVVELASWIVLHGGTVGPNSTLGFYFCIPLLSIYAGGLEAATATYLGEVSQPYLRGIFSAAVNVCFTLGLFLRYAMDTSFSWHVNATICAAMSFVSFLSFSVVPESPIWLLRRCDPSKAMKSLRWLRGWSDQDSVQDEFAVLKGFCENKCGKDRMEFSAFFKRETLIPTAVLSVYFFICQLLTLFPFRYYWHDMFGNYDFPIPNDHISNYISGLQFVGSVGCVLLVRIVGKRPLTLYCVGFSSISCIFFGCYPLLKAAFPAYAPKISFPVFCLYQLGAGLGPVLLPFMLAFEIVTGAGRNIGTSCSYAVFYVSGLVFTYAYPSVATVVPVFGWFLFIGAAGLLANLTFYFYLPETEGRTLAEIERHFAGEKIVRK